MLVDTVTHWRKRKFVENFKSMEKTAFCEALSAAQLGLWLFRGRMKYKGLHPDDLVDGS